MHLLGGYRGLNQNGGCQFRSKKITNHFRRTPATREGHGDSRKAVDQMMKSFAQIEDAALVEPCSRVEQLKGAGELIITRDKEARFHTVRNVGHAVRVEIVIQLKDVPYVAAIRMG